MPLKWIKLPWVYVAYVLNDNLGREPHSGFSVSLTLSLLSVSLSLSLHSFFPILKKKYTLLIVSKYHFVIVMFTDQPQVIMLYSLYFHWMKWPNIFFVIHLVLQKKKIFCQLDLLFKHVYGVEVEYNHDGICVWCHLILCLLETVESKYVYVGINWNIELIYWSFNNGEETNFMFYRFNHNIFLNFC